MSQARYRYILAFGSNLGDKKKNLETGLNSLLDIGSHVKISQWLETAPLESTLYSVTNHDNYINFVSEFSTVKTPSELYLFIEASENKVGHSRVSKWLPRELDIDILFCGLEVKNNFNACIPLRYKGKDDLEIPHRSFWNRDFLIKLCIEDLRIDKNALEAHTAPKTPAVPKSN